MTRALVITGGTVIDPSGSVSARGLTIEGDRIVALTNHSAEYIDATGLHIAPGIVDLGVLRSTRRRLLREGLRGLR